jgi:hypothetical protein
MIGMTDPNGMSEKWRNYPRLFFVRQAFESGASQIPISGSREPEFGCRRLIHYGTVLPSLSSVAFGRISLNNNGSSCFVAQTEKSVVRALQIILGFFIILGAVSAGMATRRSANADAASAMGQKTGQVFLCVLGLALIVRGIVGKSDGNARNRGGRGRDYYDDDRPRSKRSRYDDEDRPRSRRSRDDDDERPRTSATASTLLESLPSKSIDEMQSSSAMRDPSTGNASSDSEEIIVGELVEDEPADVSPGKPLAEPKESQPQSRDSDDEMERRTSRRRNVGWPRDDDDPPRRLESATTTRIQPMARQNLARSD